ncbi:MAG: hypothetical protein ACXWC2_12955 [Ramlibacter sp.]
MAPGTCSAVATLSPAVAVEPGVDLSRLVILPNAWAVLGYMQCHAAPAALAWTAMAVAAGIGAFIALRAGDDTQWDSLCAIPVVLAGPALMRYWGVMGREEPAWERLTFFKSVLLIGGLLLLPWLRSGVTDARRPPS